MILNLIYATYCFAAPYDAPAHDSEAKRLLEAAFKLSEAIGSADFLTEGEGGRLDDKGHYRPNRLFEPWTARCRFHSSGAARFDFFGDGSRDARMLQSYIPGVENRLYATPGKEVLQEIHHPSLFRIFPNFCKDVMSAWWTPINNFQKHDMLRRDVAVREIAEGGRTYHVFRMNFSGAGIDDVWIDMQKCGMATRIESFRVHDGAEKLVDRTTIRLVEVTDFAGQKLWVPCECVRELFVSVGVLRADDSINRESKLVAKYFDRPDAKWVSRYPPSSIKLNAPMTVGALSVEFDAHKPIIDRRKNPLPDPPTNLSMVAKSPSKKDLDAVDASKIDPTRRTQPSEFPWGWISLAVACAAVLVLAIMKLARR
jgi:hypothetical protein